MIDTTKNWFQLSQRQQISPFPNYLSMECITKEMKGVIGVAYREDILILKENIFYAFFDKYDHRRVGEAVLKKVLARPDIFVRFAKKQKVLAKGFYIFLKKNNNPKRLLKISSKQLAALHEEYGKRYKEVYAMYFPILSVENYLFGYLGDYVSKREVDTKKASRYIDTLITERTAMVNRQEIIAALKVCIRIQKNKKWLSYFKKVHPKKIVAKINTDPALQRLIKAHESRYYWITRDYEEPILTYEDFVIRFKEHLRGNPKEALNKYAAEDVKLEKDMASIYKKIKVNKKYQRLFQTMREGIYYKELRKSIVSQTLFLYDPILKEIARRGTLSLRQVRHLRVSEVRKMLVQNKDMTHELNERIKLSVWHVHNGKLTVYTGSPARKYYNFFVRVNKKAKIFQGMPVSPGLATGRVKVVINKDDFHKVKKGDIIVSIQATPIFTHVLSMASALICDGGPGITSHPATLARESGIPGIIGLRMVTKVLKDGDIVEVDGNRGIVKKV